MAAESTFLGLGGRQMLSEAQRCLSRVSCHSRVEKNRFPGMNILRD